MSLMYYNDNELGEGQCTDLYDGWIPMGCSGFWKYPDGELKYFINSESREADRLNKDIQSIK